MLSIFHTFLSVNIAFNILREKKMIKLARKSFIRKRTPKYFAVENGREMFHNLDLSALSGLGYSSAFTVGWKKC